MSAELDTNRRASQEPAASEASLQRASLTLRAIRQRYETGRHACRDARANSVQMVVDAGDMAWIGAAIEAVENAIAGRAAQITEPARARADRESAFS
jgi:hypothetical protein